MKFKNKPIVIEAEQFLGLTQHQEGGIPIPAGLRFRRLPGSSPFHDAKEAFCITVHGQETTCVDGDWIITEPDEIHHYPCKPDIFHERYEVKE